MNSILQKYDDLDKVAEEAAIKIFMEDMKKCSKCGEVKSTGEFSKDKSKKDWLKNQCKACVKYYNEVNKEKVKERRKIYREANKAKIAEQKKDYNEANKAKIAEQKKDYNENNKEKLKAYHEANKEKIKERRKAYYEKNKEEIAERRKAYREANKDAIAEKKRVYQKANKEEIAEKKRVYHKVNKTKIAERNKAYYEKNKEEIDERTKVYREAKRNKRIEQLKQIIEPNTDGKWIYIMQCGIYNKIGMSGDPLRRVEEIENQTQSPTEIIYLAKANYGRTIDAEQIIHHELSSLNVPMPYANGERQDHVSKEWFYGSLDKMVEIVSQYATVIEVD